MVDGKIAPPPLSLSLCLSLSSFYRNLKVKFGCDENTYTCACEYKSIYKIKKISNVEVDIDKLYKDPFKGGKGMGWVGLGWGV
jgi:hypothetical protein